MGAIVGNVKISNHHFTGPDRAQPVFGTGISLLRCQARAIHVTARNIKNQPIFFGRVCKAHLILI